MHRQREGFTIIELIIAIVLIGFFSIGAMKAMAERNKKEQIEKMYQEIIEIIDNAVYNPIKGYVSDKGGSCSANYDTRNITVARVRACAGLNTPSVEGVDPLDPEDSYFSYLGFISDEAAGCRIYFAPSGDYALRIFADCSYVNESAGEIEQGLASYLRDKMGPAFKFVYGEALDLATTVGGTHADGKVLIEVQK